MPWFVTVISKVTGLPGENGPGVPALSVLINARSNVWWKPKSSVILPLSSSVALSASSPLLGNKLDSAPPLGSPLLLSVIVPERYTSTPAVILTLESVATLSSGSPVCTADGTNPFKPATLTCT